MPTYGGMAWEVGKHSNLKGIEAQGHVFALICLGSAAALFNLCQFEQGTLTSGT